MRKIYILLLACPLLSLFVACNDNDYKASVTELRLVLVKPTNVYSGEIATILGRNFSTVPEENAVFINDQQATVIEAFKDELKIILPEMAPGKYSIRVKSPSGELTGLELNYLKTPDQEYIVQTIVGQKGVFEMTDGSVRKPQPSFPLVSLLLRMAVYGLQNEDTTIYDVSLRTSWSLHSSMWQ